MAKIPFDIKYRPQIESGEYKVETRDHIPVTILEWDEHIHGMSHRILGRFNDKIDFWDMKGRYNDVAHDCNLDLFIIMPEEELSEFKLALRNAMADTIALAEGKDDDETSEIADKQAKRYASELLALAKNQLQKEGLVTMEHLNTACEAEYQSGLADGKAEAMKDLPRWKKYSKGTEIDPLAVVRFSDGYIGRSKYASEDCYVLEVKDMLKLPGFKEDEK